MRALRSIVCAGLALIAVSLCSAMPAAASVPIDVSVAVSTTAKELHPAPAVHVAVQDVAVLPTAVTLKAPDNMGRSSAGNDSPTFADTSIVPPAYQHIDPDITA